MRQGAVNYKALLLPVRYALLLHVLTTRPKAIKVQPSLEICSYVCRTPSEPR